MNRENNKFSINTVEKKKTHKIENKIFFVVDSIKNEFVGTERKLREPELKIV